MSKWEGSTLMRLRMVLVGFFSLILGIVPLGFGLITGASTTLADGVCWTAGTSGLTASIVAMSGQHISGLVDASGCDLGVYVGPGVTNVVISGATVENANDHGILVQDTSNVQILNNTVTHNVVNKHDAIAEDKAISLIGTNNVTVSGNIVFNNVGSGGISINDDGPANPGGLNPGMSRPGSNNVVSNNQVFDNHADCGIVVSAYNPGEGTNHNLIEGNTVSRNVAGIVVAADPPGTEANFNKVIRNTVTDNFIPGIIVHSNTPGDEVGGTVVMFNTVSGNGPDGEVGLDAPTGIVLAGTTFGPTTPPAIVTNSVVMFNRISNEYYGIAEVNAQRTTVLTAGLDQATVPVYTAR